jgi:hypothetical protein
MLYIASNVHSPKFTGSLEMEEKNLSIARSSYSDSAHADLFSDENVDPVYQAKIPCSQPSNSGNWYGKVPGQFPNKFIHFLLIFEHFCSGICL